MGERERPQAKESGCPWSLHKDFSLRRFLLDFRLPELQENKCTPFYIMGYMFVRAAIGNECKHRGLHFSGPLS
jgi:hypothetical protein